MLAIYNTICDWESNTIDQVHLKFNALMKIETIITSCEKLKELIDVLDMTHKLKLMRTINCEKLDEIDATEDKEEREQKLKDFFKETSQSATLKVHSFHTNRSCTDYDKDENEEEKSKSSRKVQNEKWKNWVEIKSNEELEEED
jgi:hypothetical protein